MPCKCTISSSSLGSSRTIANLGPVQPKPCWVNRMNLASESLSTLKSSIFAVSVIVISIIDISYTYIKWHLLVVFVDCPYCLLSWFFNWKKIGNSGNCILPLAYNICPPWKKASAACEIHWVKKVRSCILHCLLVLCLIIDSKDIKVPNQARLSRAHRTIRSQSDQFSKPIQNTSAKEKGSMA